MSRVHARQGVPSEAMRLFSKNFKRLLSERGITQSEAAMNLRLTPATVSDYIYCKISPEWGTLDRICEYFNVTPSELFANDNGERMQKMIWMTRSYLEQLEKLSGGLKP